VANRLNKLKFWDKKPQGFYKISSANILLKSHTNILDRIYRHSRSPHNHYQNYYLYSINKIAELLQLLPASQAHHHAFNGGFLLHNLEVIELALEKRNEKLLPLGSTPEVQNYKKDVYSFGVFIAAIMHDIGKIITDIEVFLYDKKYQELGRWSPFTSSITTNKQAVYYKYFYNPDRRYSDHPLCASLLLTQIVNPVALDWVKQEPELWNMLLMTIGGRGVEGGVIADIIKHADSTSVANSLKNNPVINNAPQEENARPKSLAEKLLDTLRYITLEVPQKINEPGAGIFTTNTDVWYVSKRTIDEVKKQLRRDKQTGVPNDNVRIMDEMLQFKIIIPNDKNKAIWDCNLTDGGFKKPQKLTMLRVAIDKIYTNNNAPEPFAGDISLIETGEIISNTKTQTQAIENNIASDIQNKNHDDIDKALNESINNTAQNSSTVDTNDEIIPGFDDLVFGTDNKEDTTENVENIIIDSAENNTNTTDNKDNATKDSTQVAEEELDKSLGESFMQWLKESIKNDDLEINNPQAKLHVVSYANQDSLFLVSPRIFKEYDKDNWESVQKQFTRTKYNEKSYNNDNIWKVQTLTTRKHKEGSVIKGYLISDIKSHGFTNLPSSNKYITLITPTTTKENGSKD
jgi:integrating conjugative element relaxase (TIGR03760 family)